MKIAYGYIYGRKDRLKNNEYPEEMFYGYHYFLKKFGSVEIIEYEKSSLKILEWIEKIVIKITKLPIHFSQLTNIKNFRQIMTLDYLILTNDRLLFSLLPLLLIRTMVKGKLQVTVFAMNMFQENDLIKINFIKKFIMMKSYHLVNNYIFLGKGESELAIKFFQSSKKINFIPFYVDETFWNRNEHTKREGVLFVGNDSNREFNKVVEIANKLPNIQFTIISKQLKRTDFSNDNVRFIRGSWGNQEISDSELRKIYSQSKLVIIPLKESFQPSGQSVTLQAMALKTPVLITSTKGFWDVENFKNNKNIFFNYINSTESWIEMIQHLYKNRELLSEVTENAYKVIHEKYSKESFEKELLKIVGL